jgi:hypothetical protein
LAQWIDVLLAALSLATVLALIWLYVEQKPQEKIANHACWITEALQKDLEE